MNLQNTVLRTNFANGVVSPGIWNRTDWNKHASSVREAKNFFVSPTGGLRKRPGTRFLEYGLYFTDPSGKPRAPHLIKFEFSLGQTYILEFGDGIMRIWIDDHPIINPDTNDYYTLASPYSYDQIVNISHSQYKDTMFFTHWDHPIRKLVRGASATHTNWYWDTVIVNEAGLVRAPQNLTFEVEGHTGHAYSVTAVKDGRESKGSNEVLTTRIQDEGVVEAYSNGIGLPVYSNDLYQRYLNVKAWLDNNRAILGGLPGYPVLSNEGELAYQAMLAEYNRLYAIYEQQMAAYAQQVADYNNAINIYNTVAQVPSDYDLIDMVYTVHPYIIQGLNFVFPGVYDIRHDTIFRMVSTSPANYYSIAIIRFTYVGVNYAVGLWSMGESYGNVSKGAGIYHVPGYDGGSIVGNAGYHLLLNADTSNAWYYQYGEYENQSYYRTLVLRNYLLSQIEAKIPAYPTLPTPPTMPAFTYDATPVYNQIINFVNWQAPKINNRITWRQTDPADSYKIYRRILSETTGSSTFSLYYVTTVPGTTFSWEDADVNATQQVYNSSPPIAGQYFDNPANYPMVNTLFQQRLVVGSTKTSPLMIGASIAGDMADFSESDNLLDTFAAWKFELTSGTSNPVKHMIPIRTLYILSEAGAFVSTASGAVSASNVNFNQEAYNGASDIAPAIVDKSGIYVPLNRQMISSLTYEFANDAFADDNMVFDCQTLLSGTLIRSLAYCRPISSLIFVTLEDGRMLSCTFIPRQQFLAWTEIITQGEFYQACTCTNKNGYDELYLTVWRNGRYLIEKMEDVRPFQDLDPAEDVFLDSVLSGVFTNEVSVLSGLEHLEGMTVSIVADGSIQPDRVVTNGQIVLDTPATIVHVGLAYTASMETLDLEIQSLPTLRGTMRHIVKAVVEIEQTADLTWQINDGDKWDAVIATASELADAPKTKTLDIAIGGACDYIDGTRLRFESRYPLPCSINSLVAEVQYG